MNRNELFLQQVKKHKHGTVRKRMSNIGLSYCFYDKNENPVIYITPKQFETMLELFDYNLQTGYYTPKPTK